MLNIKTILMAGLFLSSMVACSAPRMITPVQPVMRASAPQALRSMSTSAKTRVYKFKLTLSPEELSQLQDDFMLNLNLSSDLMGFYFSHPQYRQVYSNTFVGTNGFRQLKAVVLSFEVFDPQNFEQEVLPQIRSLIEVNGRKLIAS